MKIRLTGLIVALSFSCACFAQQSESSNLDLATSYIENQCDFDIILSKGLTLNKWFVEYDRYVTEKALVACRAIFDDKSITPVITDYWSSNELSEILKRNLSELDRAFSLSGDSKFDILKISYSTWRSETTLPIRRGVPMPASFDSRPRDFEREYFLTTTTGLPSQASERFKLNTEQNTYCANRFSDAKDCVEVFDAFNKINRKLSIFQRLNAAQEHNAYVAIQEAKWDKFSDNSRFQTFIDVAFTSWIYRDHFSRTDDLITPPPLQLYALRPSLVYEHLSDAPNGDRDEVAVALEWVGFNAWDLKIPFGVSVTSVYSDRATGKSVGHGLTFHVNNSFSFGFANRGGGENSFYVNFELMEWFGENQEMLKAYKRFR
ncbi:hypothetical protein [Rheinheimera sp.]|uniref:hypothetical protein n=1 Tax=Rheinheimera sp. TaxID=1869214 RepID=UPI0027338DAB|nr:hypothetical protein [Rheinheimera sp.]MDP2713806.1 hypothetical protein [Rheinheimera sp.]